MGLIVVPEQYERRRQPQVGVRVNRRHPWAQHLRFAYVATVGRRGWDAVSRASGALVYDQPALAVGRFGYASEHLVGGAWNWLDFAGAASAANVTGPLTVIAAVRPASVASDQYVLSKTTGNGGTATPFSLGLSSAGIALNRANASSYRVWKSAASVSAGVDVVIAATQAGDISVAPRFFVDGKLDTVAASSIYGGGASGAATGNMLPVVIGNRDDDSTKWDGRIYIGLVIAGEVPVSDMASLGANPAQMFE